MELGYYAVTGFAPDLSELDSVTVKVVNGSATLFDGDVAVMHDEEMGYYGLMIMVTSEEDPDLVFIARYYINPMSGEFYPSDTSSTIYLSNSDWAGATLIVEIPYTKTTVTPIPAKFLTEAPSATFESGERVVGTYFGKPLYEQTIRLNHTSALSNTTSITIPDGIIEYGYLVDAFIMLFSTGNTFVKSYNPFYDKDGNCWQCTLNSDSITTYRDLADPYDSYEYVEVARIRYTKIIVEPTQHTITFPNDVQHTSQGSGSSMAMCYGNIDRELELVDGNSYDVSFTVQGQTQTVTIRCTEYSGGILYLDGDSSIGYLDIYAGARWDYEQLDETGDPTLVARDAGDIGYCFKADDDMSSYYTITVDVSPAS